MNFTPDVASPLCNSRPIHPLVLRGMELSEGLIVVKINGEGRGVTCRVMKPKKQKHETKHCS
jgi:hypothetical protein